MNPLSKEGQAWRLSWHKDLQGFGKKRRGEQVGERLQVNFTYTPPTVGSQRENFLMSPSSRGCIRGEQFVTDFSSGKEKGGKEGREKEGGAEGEEFLMVSKKSWLPNNELPLSLVQQPHDFTKRPTWTIWRGPTSHLQLPSKSGTEGKHFRAEHKADSEGGAF